MDLQAAAKVAIAVETLDQIAEENQKQFEEARSAFSEDGESSLEEQGAEFHERHQRLWQRWQKSELTPRQLRRELVRYYVKRAEEAVMVRFFREVESIKVLPE